MQFPASFFYDEVRDGFFVSSLMKRAWAAQLEVLDDFDKLCRKYDLKYWGEWGTMLAAVRHGGMIPWDDDIDVAMKREDYQKLLTVIHELPSCYSLFGYMNDDDSWQYIYRIINENTIKFDEDRLGKFHGFPFNAGIDLYVLDYLDPDTEEQKKLKNKIKYVNNVAAAVAVDNSNIFFYEDELKKVEALTGEKIDRKSCVKRQLFAINEHQFNTYKGEEAREITEVTHWVNHDFIMPADAFDHFVRIPFENTSIPVPQYYYRILHKKFGNFMQIVKQWDSHGYPFYLKQEQILKERTGASLRHYSFKPEDVIYEKETGRHINDTIKEYLGIFEEVHKIAKNSETDKTQILAKCQELAVNLGNAIEGEYGEGTRAVGLLEQYCEVCYELSVGALKDFEQMGAVLESFKAVAKEELVPRKKIVFITSRADNWCFYDFLYQKHGMDKETDIYVLPIPYYDKGNFGELTEKHFETEGLPEGVKMLDYRTVKLSAFHPDIIYTQDTYGEYSFGSSIEPQFYSSEIKKYTDMLVYVPDFSLEEFDERDGKALQSMDYFVTMPGVVNADRVLLESEKRRELYIKKLMEMAKNQTGRDYREIWEEKLVVASDACRGKLFSLARADLMVEKLFPKFSAEMADKKVILYTLNPGGWLENKKAYADKLARSLDLLDVCKDRMFVIIKLGQTAEDISVEMKNTVTEITKNYGCGVIYGDACESYKLALLCDACFGDEDPVQQLFRILHKPVMIQDYNL